MNEKHIYKIIITGGPCAGKTTAMDYMKNYFAERGYAVIVIPETATELILGGIAPWTCKTVKEYQRCQMQLQISKEEIFLRGVNCLKEDKILLVCDRGLLDNKAYMLEKEFYELAEELNVPEEEMLARYDAVFHLETVAKDNPDSYTLDNNGARIETVEEAIAVDTRLVEAWSKHPNLCVISSHADVESKLNFLVGEIAKHLDMDKVKSPGVKYTHYKPKCQTTLYEYDQLDLVEKEYQAQIENGKIPFIMCEDKVAKVFEGKNLLNLGENELEIASNLYDKLIEGEKKADIIIAVALKDEKGVNLGIMNRLRKSCG